MDLTSIGKNLRKFRTEKGMMQETLAEKANLSPNYIGMIERGEKIPSLTPLIRLANALDITADMLLCDVLTATYAVKPSVTVERISALPKAEQDRIFAVIDTLIDHAK